MTNQLMLQLPKVDEKATRAEVKKAFKQYLEHKATLKTATVASFSVLRGCGGSPSMNTTARIPLNDADAIRGSSKRRTAFQEMSTVVERLIDQEEQLNKRKAQLAAMAQFCEAVETAVANLPDYERQIIQRTLMTDKSARKQDSLIWPELGLGRSDYYKYKEKALLRIGFALVIEVYEEAAVA